MGAVCSKDVERGVAYKITQVEDRTDVGITFRLIVGKHVMKMEGKEQCDIHTSTRTLPIHAATSPMI
jgi:hypothetical protein